MCQICGYVYDDAKEKVPFSMLPDDWKCPLCGVAKSDFKAEDIMREAGYMLPQSDNAHKLLEELIKNPPTGEFPVEAAKKLLKLIPNNEKKEANC